MDRPGDGYPLTAMADDWRVELDVEDRDVVHRAIDRLRERGVARDAREQLPGDAVISVSADRIFAYVATREQAQASAAALTRLAAEHHLTARTTIARWDAAAEAWVPASP